jgi:hypothetical protein
MRTPVAVSIVLALLLGLGQAAAVAQAPAPGRPTPADGAATSPGATAQPASVEGTVKKVDPAVSQIQVAWGLFGLFGRTLSVTSDTDIQVEGRKATLADIREGSRAKVAYETREGRSIAKQIQVVSEPRPAR